MNNNEVKIPVHAKACACVCLFWFQCVKGKDTINSTRTKIPSHVNSNDQYNISFPFFFLSIGALAIDA